MKNVKTTCPYCGVGCGVVAGVSDNKITLKGDVNHPANNGILCSKGMALAETLDPTDRLLTPEVNGLPTSWEDALDQVAEGFKDTIKKYGPDSVAFYVSGQFLTEDYYVANKLMKGFIGSGNIDTNSRLCMSSSVAGHKRAFGADAVPGNYTDWDECDVAILVGSNAAWCHPILFQRLLGAQKTRNAKIIVIDPRHTATCDVADLHLPLLPGSDVILFNGLLVYLVQNGGKNSEFIAKHTNGLDDALKAATAEAPNIKTVAKKCGLTVQKVTEFYQLVLANERMLSIYSQGVNQSSSGTDKVNAIINCHLLTGRIGKTGMGPFSITGQPNAMGGREVGGLAHMLAAHMEFTPDHIDLVSKFWQAPNIATKAGAKAIDMFDKIADGSIKAVWIMATNPAVSMPDANKVQQALKNCPLVVVSDCMHNTDTMKYADIKLPAQTWGEKDGTMTNSERRISRQRRFLKPVGQSKADWWAICQVAQKMGFETQFNYANSAEIYREHARLSGFENNINSKRMFNIGLHADISAQNYAELSPTQWPISDESPYGTAHLFGNAEFLTQDGKANFVATKYKPAANLPTRKYPLILNTGRIRDQWHTMSRTGKSSKLNNQIAEPFMQVSPTDAKKHNIINNGFVEISSPQGNALVRANVSDNQAAGQAFMPIHWTDAYASDAVVGRLVTPAIDAISGQPEFKHTPVDLKTWTPDWHGYLLSHKKYDIEKIIADKNIHYWAYNYQDGCHKLNLAGYGNVDDVSIIAALKQQSNGSLLSYKDENSGQYRYATHQNNQLTNCFMATSHGVLPPQDWLQQIMKERQDISGKMGYLLSGISQDNAPNLGPIICSCLGVYKSQIQAAQKKHNLTTVEQVGKLLKAGTNCGSCLSEIKQLLPNQT